MNYFVFDYFNEEKKQKKVWNQRSEGKMNFH